MIEILLLEKDVFARVFTLKLQEETYTLGCYKFGYVSINADTKISGLVDKTFILDDVEFQVKPEYSEDKLTYLEVYADGVLIYAEGEPERNSRFKSFFPFSVSTFAENILGSIFGLGGSLFLAYWVIIWIADWVGYGFADLEILFAILLLKIVQTAFNKFIKLLGLFWVDRFLEAFAHSIIYILTYAGIVWFLANKISSNLAWSIETDIPLILVCIGSIIILVRAWFLNQPAEGQDQRLFGEGIELSIEEVLKFGQISSTYQGYVLRKRYKEGDKFVLKSTPPITWERMMGRERVELVTTGFHLGYSVLIGMN